MSNQGIRHRRWLLMLTAIGLGWVVATSVTVLGMFMTACRRNVKPEMDLGGLCHSSSLKEGYAMVGFGSLMNVTLLVTMLVLLMRDRRKNRVKPDPPPDYESLIKEETPPPSYFELNLGESARDVVAVASPSAFSSPSPSSFSSSSPSSSSSSSPTPIDSSGSTPPTTTTVSPPTTVSTGVSCTKSSSPEASLRREENGGYSNDLTIFL